MVKRKMGEKYVGTRVNEKIYQQLIDLANERSKQENRRVSLGSIIKEAILKYLEGEAEEK